MAYSVISVGVLKRALRYVPDDLSISFNVHTLDGVIEGLGEIDIQSSKVVIDVSLISDAYSF